jgi:hypothetical protein
MLAVAKLFNTLYMSKWKGDTSLRRFRAIRGNDMQFFNIATEDKAALKAIYKSMKKHGILVGRLPDLCGGDGKTQIVISPCDMSKMESFLLDHKNGKYGGIKISPISAADYERTGHTRDGRLTPEYEGLERSAERRQKRRLQDREALPMKSQEVTEFLMVVKQKEQQGDGEREKVRIHHEEAYCGSHSNWISYSIEDGKRAVLVPRKDISEKDADGTVEAAIEFKKEYICIDKSNGELTHMGGRDVATALKREPVRILYRKTVNLVKNSPKVASVTQAVRRQIFKQ